ncbi:MAG: N-6 DNA methylase [Rhodocyclaceae bacterium]
MSNERITENLVRDEFRRLGYYDENNDVVVEEQKSQIVAVANLLRGASKSGLSNRGAPEFIVSATGTPDFLVVFECKAKLNQHESEMHDRPKDFAVDGVLHYAKHLQKEFNVIAVAVSGQKLAQAKISTFLCPKGSSEHKPLVTKTGQAITQILSVKDYIDHGTYDPEVTRKRHEDLMSFSRELHDFMRDHAKLTESEKPLLVSGTLIALRNKAFSVSFGEYNPADLQKQWMRVIKEEMKNADIPHSKEYSMTQPYSSIAVHPELGKPTTKYPRGVLYELIKRLNEKVWPFISVYHDFDVVGQFYGEFLKYTGGDKKALGIVLTPRHITELFSLVSQAHKGSKVLDICAGTGGFLIAAMHQMLRTCTSEAEELDIKKNRLIGVEQQPNMYALGASNMILRGDGKANLHQGSCFDEGIVKELKQHNCDIGMINPPYSQSDEELHELIFVKHMLTCLASKGVGIAIVPIGCAISNHPVREEILKEHTLEAVMSLPDDLFYPVGVVPCIMVFTAHQPHDASSKKTWFGLWKKDGFVKTKHRGRVDDLHTWPAIRDQWVSSYLNRDEIPGHCTKAHVTAQDEWCAEAFMETDYDELSIDCFKSVVLNYLSHNIVEEEFGIVSEIVDAKPVKKVNAVDHSKWAWFRIDELFDLKKGKRLTKANMTTGATRFIGAIDSNNGLREKIGQKPIHKGNTITVNYNGSVGEAFYQPKPFWASDDVNVLYPKFDMNVFSGLFIATIIRLEKVRFNYGRKWHLERMAASRIKLPALKSGDLDVEYMERFIKSLPFKR